MTRTALPRKSNHLRKKSHDKKNTYERTHQQMNLLLKVHEQFNEFQYKRRKHDVTIIMIPRISNKENLYDNHTKSIGFT